MSRADLANLLQLGDVGTEHADKVNLPAFLCAKSFLQAWLQASALHAVYPYKSCLARTLCTEDVAALRRMLAGMVASSCAAYLHPTS